MNHSINDCKKLISSKRFESYRQKCPNLKLSYDDIDVLTAYLTNVKVSAMLYPLLNIFEVALRNIIDHNMKIKYQKNSWLLGSGYCKFQNDSILFHDFLQDRSIEAINKVIQKRVSSKKKYDHDIIISELNLGFWCHLFSKKNQQEFGNFLIKKCFNNSYKKYSRKEIFDMLKMINDFRNRVFHHETIIFYNINKIRNEILELLKSISHSSTLFVKLLSDDTINIENDNIILDNIATSIRNQLSENIIT